MFKLNNCRWRMALAAIVALSIGFSSQAAEIDQIGTPESTAILTVGQVVKSVPGIECIKKDKAYIKDRRYTKRRGRES